MAAARNCLRLSKSTKSYLLKPRSTILGPACATISSPYTSTRVIPALASYPAPHRFYTIERQFSSSPAFYSNASANKWANNEDVEYEELKPITQQPNDDILLIDVREPDEVAQGSIPSSVNVPLSQFYDAFSKEDGDFFRAYGFRKPMPDQNIILYCRSGKRSASALDIAKWYKYNNVRNYKGSYLDWIEKDKNSASLNDDDD